MLRNLVGLYSMQLASAALPLVTVPYLARVLGPSAWGLGLFVQAIGLWLSVVIEYGFNLSAAREVAWRRAAGAPVQDVVAAVFGAKLLLTIAAAAVAIILYACLPVLRGHPGLFGWTFVYAAALGFSPFWYFQGVERILPAAAIEFVARAASVGVTFAFVKSPADLERWLSVQALAAVGCTTACVWWLSVHVKLVRPTLAGSFDALKRGWDMTLFRAVTSLSTSINTLVLGFVCRTEVVAYFAAAEKISRAEAALLLPVSQVVYPRVSGSLDAKRKSSRLAIYSIGVTIALAVCGALAAALTSVPVLHFALGPNFAASSPPFRILQLLVILTAARTAVAMCWLLPAGLESAAGAWLVIGLAVSITAGAIVAPWFGAAGMSWAAVAAESLVLAGYVWTATKPRAPRGNNMVAPAAYAEAGCCR